VRLADEIQVVANRVYAIGLARKRAPWLESSRKERSVAEDRLLRDLRPQDGSTKPRSERKPIAYSPTYSCQSGFREGEADTICQRNSGSASP
jgi:hypothetical protein